MGGLLLQCILSGLPISIFIFITSSSLSPWIPIKRVEQEISRSQAYRMTISSFSFLLMNFNLYFEEGFFPLWPSPNTASQNITFKCQEIDSFIVFRLKEFHILYGFILLLGGARCGHHWEHNSSFENTRTADEIFKRLKVLFVLWNN